MAVIQQLALPVMIILCASIMLAPVDANKSSKPAADGGQTKAGPSNTATGGGSTKAGGRNNAGGDRNNAGGIRNNPADDRNNAKNPRNTEAGGTNNAGDPRNTAAGDRNNAGGLRNTQAGDRNNAGDPRNTEAGGTNNAGDPRNTAAGGNSNETPRQPIFDWNRDFNLTVENIARIVYQKLTNTSVENESTDDLANITAAQIQNKKDQFVIKRDSKRYYHYYFRDNELLKTLVPPVTFKNLRDKIKSKNNNYSLMEAALRLCILEDEWTRNKLKMLFPVDKAQYLAEKLGLTMDSYFLESSSLAKRLRSISSNQGEDKQEKGQTNPIYGKSHSNGEEKEKKT